MDKFSELIAKGVAKFEYQPIAQDVPGQCPVCRAYNNLFGAATDTHMSCLDDGTKVITGHIIADKSKFNSFIWRSQYNGVNFSQAGYYSFGDFLSRHELCGRYELLNGDEVYVLNHIDREQQNDPCCLGDANKCCMATVTAEGQIPVNIRFISRRANIEDVLDCLAENNYDTAKKLNENRNIIGCNWQVVNLSEGQCIVGYYNNKNYKLS